MRASVSFLPLPSFSLSSELCNGVIAGFTIRKRREVREAHHDDFLLLSFARLFGRGEWNAEMKGRCNEKDSLLRCLRMYSYYTFSYVRSSFLFFFPPLVRVRQMGSIYPSFLPRFLDENGLRRKTCVDCIIRSYHKSYFIYLF